MFKQLMTLALIGLLIQMTYAKTVTANTRAEKEARFAEKVKAGIVKLGKGREVLVKVKLRDKTKLTGYVSEVNDSSFIIVDVKTGIPVTVAYPDVTQVKGHNSWSGTTIAITIGIALVLIVVLVATVGRS